MHRLCRIAHIVLDSDNNQAYTGYCWRLGDPENPENVGTGYDGGEWSPAYRRRTVKLYGFASAWGKTLLAKAAR